mmetsp:Transcript_12723/g.32624  ORF Transcript_12723/g.32624 Transcript_12723/m.32624 type:complete len:359 (-) Transcript_12723:473-1549(-)
MLHHHNGYSPDDTLATNPAATCGMPPSTVELLRGSVSQTPGAVSAVRGAPAAWRRRWLPRWTPASRRRPSLACWSRASPAPRIHKTCARGVMAHVKTPVPRRPPWLPGPSTGTSPLYQRMVEEAVRWERGGGGRSVAGRLAGPESHQRASHLPLPQARQQRGEADDEERVDGLHKLGGHPSAPKVHLHLLVCVHRERVALLLVDTPEADSEHTHSGDCKQPRAMVANQRAKSARGTGGAMLCGVAASMVTQQAVWRQVAQPRRVLHQPERHRGTGRVEAGAEAERGVQHPAHQRRHEGAQVDGAVEDEKGSTAPRVSGVVHQPYLAADVGLEGAATERDDHQRGQEGRGPSAEQKVAQ